MSAARITAGVMSASRIYGDTLGACLINAGTVSADVILAGTMSAARITAGTMAADRIYGGSIGACSISGNYIDAGVINANLITAGTLVADCIAARSLYGIKIGTGNTYGVYTENLIDQTVTQIENSFIQSTVAATYGSGSKVVASAFLDTTAYAGAIQVQYISSHITSSGQYDSYSLKRNGAAIASQIIENIGAGKYHGLAIGLFDVTGAGTYLYTVEMNAVVGGSCEAYNRTLLAMEVKR
jgi:hypothetical protein